MKKSLIIFLLPVLYSSQVMTEMEVFNNSNGNVFNVKNTKFNSYEGIDGSPYINQLFLPIKIDGYNKLLPMLRYNAYEDEMEFKIENNLSYVQKIGEMKITFIANNKSYVLKNYNIDGDSKSGYLVELVTERNKFALYKKEFIQILEYNNNTTNTYLKHKNPYFERAKDILILSYGENYIKFPKSANDLTLWIENKTTFAKSSDVQNFIKKNKINFKKETDLISLVTFMNSL